MIYSSINGCDSIIILDLNINNSSVSVDSIVACDSLVWIDGLAYTSNNNSASFLTNSSIIATAL